MVYKKNKKKTQKRGTAIRKNCAKEKFCLICGNKSKCHEKQLKFGGEKIGKAARKRAQKI